ncbi:hypothetical protein ISG05_05310 [Burkholderia pseudomallei]|uniref:hypothetical protein n=1 Tax=Burkholderia pseudomallei TaxID=28450 RepID=UPI00160500D7|nr:hypothetical protein [Burkholderia pseudomallei]MBF3808605.1 hypothetical protein [Burkholderia pseudomallei]MBF3839832.1 hypothetical protein [Burkholderia pseudomallei]
MRQDLVDPAARHHIAAEKQAHAGVKRRVIGFVHRIAARAARARAPPIPIKLFGAATGARRAGTAHDVASRASASLREAAPREPPASAMPPSRRPVPSGAAPGERRPTRAADAIAAAGAAGRPIFWARSEPDPGTIRARSGRASSVDRHSGVRRAHREGRR